MCTASAATAEAIYSTVDGKLAELLDTENPWKLCTSVGVDNTSVNIGIHNSLKTRVLLRNSAVYFSGCPCHILHNAAQKAAEVFSSECGFDIEEFTIDLYYWFEKSTKRKNSLRSYCEFCDQQYRSVIKHDHCVHEVVKFGNSHREKLKAISQFKIILFFCLKMTQLPDFRGLRRYSLIQ